MKKRPERQRHLQTINAFVPSVTSIEQLKTLKSTHSRHTLVTQRPHAVATSGEKEFARRPPVAVLSGGKRILKAETLGRGFDSCRVGLRILFSMKTIFLNYPLFIKDCSMKYVYSPFRSVFRGVTS